MDATVASHLEAVLREAVTNVARHADATSARIAVSLRDDRVSLVLSDNGKGVPDDVVGGRGLTNLASRAEELGGTFEVRRGPDGGARLEWNVPTPDASEATRTGSAG